MSQSGSENLSESTMRSSLNFTWRNSTSQYPATLKNFLRAEHKPPPNWRKQLTIRVHGPNGLLPSPLSTLEINDMYPPDKTHVFTSSAQNRLNNRLIRDLERKIGTDELFCWIDREAER